MSLEALTTGSASIAAAQRLLLHSIRSVCNLQEEKPACRAVESALGKWILKGRKVQVLRFMLFVKQSMPLLTERQQTLQQAELAKS